MSFSETLKHYQQRAEKRVLLSLSDFGETGKLREACEYALMNGGRRFRPTLVFMVADALGHNADVSAAALSIEFLHTASLIADDLPCMDNDDMRRNKPSLHCVFGETVALLASYALIAAGNQYIAKSAFEMNESTLMNGVSPSYLGVLALENAAKNNGVYGTTGGQFLDVFPSELSLELIRDVIQKKTVSLFEVSIVFGWLFGGGDPEKLPIVKSLASHFGMAFQILDDFQDMEQDLLRDRKINMVNFLGRSKATQMFHEELFRYKQALKNLNIESQELLGLMNYLENQFLSFLT